MKIILSFLFTVVLLLGGISFYLYFRIRPLLPEPGTWASVLAKVLFGLLMLSFVVGFTLQSRGLYAVSAPFTVVGSWMLGAILYMLLVFVAIDVLRLLNSFTLRLDCLSFRYVYGDSKAWFASMAGCLLTALVLVCGYFNARFPVTKRLVYETERNISRDFKYILISDVHLGMIHGDSFAELLRDRLNSEPDVDFVVIAGDFFDGDPVPVVNSRAGEILRTVNTGYGIFAVPGNHEWIGNVDVACDFLRRSGVTVLRDSVAELPFGVSIVGRDDLSLNRRPGCHRKPLAELASPSKDPDKNNYTIVLDHQPAAVDEAVSAGVDIMLSGHTHGGAQLWPLFVFSSMIYENDYGQMRKGGTDFYTSSGYGSWGPPVRTSARPEMVVIEVRKK